MSLEGSFFVVIWWWNFPGTQLAECGTNAKTTCQFANKLSVLKLGCRGGSVEPLTGLKSQTPKNVRFFTRSWKIKSIIFWKITICLSLPFEPKENKNNKMTKVCHYFKMPDSVLYTGVIAPKVTLTQIIQSNKTTYKYHAKRWKSHSEYISKISKFTWWLGACPPWTPLDDPAFGGRLFELPLSKTWIRLRIT